MKRLLTIAALAVTTTAAAQGDGLEPLAERVNVQADSARMEQVIDGEWVAVGVKRPYAICHDSNLMFDGRPSYRFELREEDNTLSGYSKDETKGRAELSYCYAVSSDFDGTSEGFYDAAQKMKTVYHSGKGIAPQGSTCRYRFSFYVPSTFDGEHASTIFAQWHGMPDRRLAQTPEGEVRMLTTEEFLALWETTIFKKDTGHEKIAATDRKGRPVFRAGEPNGWKIEQGGYPPLAFGFSGGYFYIKANSDRKWLTDKSDRCNARVDGAEVMRPVKSEYKTSTIACRIPWSEFPKDRWITFSVEVQWSLYGGSRETLERNGRLNVVMTCDGDDRTLVDNERIEIGRNDEDGYYFKFGIYRVAGSTVPVCYNLAGYSEELLRD